MIIFAAATIKTRHCILEQKKMENKQVYPDKISSTLKKIRQKFVI
jgi:predicted lipoprotein